MKKYLTTLLAACCMLAAFSMPASALEYHFDGPDAGLFGRPTSDDTIYVTMDKPANTDRSKNAAYILASFGHPKGAVSIFFGYPAIPFSGCPAFLRFIQQAAHSFGFHIFRVLRRSQKRQALHV